MTIKSVNQKLKIKANLIKLIKLKMKNNKLQISIINKFHLWNKILKNYKSRLKNQIKKTLNIKFRLMISMNKIKFFKNKLLN